MEKLKLAVYHPWIYLKGGIERSMLELITRSEHDWDIFTSHYEPENTFPEFSKMNVTELNRVPVHRDMGNVLKAAVHIFRERLPLEKYDAFVVWCDGLGDLATFRNRSLPTFCICSTPLRPVYDPVYSRNALESRHGLSRLAFISFKHLFHFIDQMAWKNYDGVFSTSTEVQNRIVRNKLYPEGARLKLFYPGVDTVSRKPQEAPPENVLLIPGRISWTKNIMLGLSAFKEANLPAPWKLVIAGFVDEKSKSYIRELKEKAAGHPGIEFYEAPSDEELHRLYEQACAILFPPENEDWGIVPLEAMQRGKPVLANNSGGPAESIIDGKTGWLTQPTVEAWTKVIKTFPDQITEIEKMGIQAKEHVKKYDWNLFTEGIDQHLSKWVKETNSSGLS